MIPAPNIDELLHALQSDEVQQRQQAAIALSRLQDERLIDPLLLALNDGDSTVRANAAAGLGHNKAENAVDPLLRLLNDEHDIVRERAATALAQIGDGRAIPALIDALDDDSTWTRNRIIYVLGASRDARAVEPLIVLLDHAEPSTQGVAAWALGSIGDPVAIDPLLGLLVDDVASVRGNAAWALGELEEARVIPPLIERLGDESAEVRGKTAWALGNLGALTGDISMVEPLIALLEDYTEVTGEAAHIFVCQYAAEALTQINTDEAKNAVDLWRPVAQAKLLPRRIDELIDALRSSYLVPRRQAMEQLVELGDVVVQPLITALKHDSAHVRQNAAQTLGMLEAGDATQALVTALADDDIGVWSQATAALAKIGTPAEKNLRKALKSKKKRVKQGAALALWRIGREEKAFQMVLQALQDDDLVVRGSAITSLWQQPDERTLATLQIRLQQEEGMMARYVLQALNALGTPAAMTTIQHWLAEHNE